LIGAGKWEPIAGLNIATMQSLVSVAKNPKTPEKCALLWHLMSDCRQVFFDEAHLMASKIEKGNEFTTVAGWFDNAYCRWGLTATPFMRANYDNLLLQGVTGETLYKIENQELINAGHLSVPKVKMIKVTGGVFVPKMSPAKMYQKAHRLGIVLHENRNQLIINEISKGPFPVLCLVSKVEHANALAEMGVALTGIVVLTGASTNAVRKEAIEGVKAGRVHAIIATTIFDEGIDLPNIRKVILAGGGKSIVKNLQRVGRGLRVTQDKDTVEIIDFFDHQHWFLKNHSKKRFALWQEQGFETEIV
jgi:superfamily II DNA or RNA helicase